MAATSSRLLQKFNATRPMAGVEIDSTLPPWRRLVGVSASWGKASAPASSKGAASRRASDRAESR
jgi:hypothetical protein